MFKPNYMNLISAARNREVKRFPLYEHAISVNIMEEITGKRFAALYDGDESDRLEFFRHYNRFFQTCGYDTVSFEVCVGLSIYGTGALGRHLEGAIQNMDDFRRYPWDEALDTYFKAATPYFDALMKTLPAGMKAVGGVGNGIFEMVEELVGYMNLCYIREDDPELYALLFQKVGGMMYDIWHAFLPKYGDAYCVCRTGDDLGFRTSTLIAPGDIRRHIIPQYKRIISLIHSYGKPFLFHSCGAIADVMEDFIAAGIDAKHSNEDQIAPFSTWVEEYGDRIGNFGGVDTDIICASSAVDIPVYVRDLVAKSVGHGGFAFGTGNSVPDYCSAKRYMEMIETARMLRGE